MSAVLERQPAATPGSFYRPNSTAQLGVHTSVAPEVLISSMYGRGKTRSLCEDADLTARSFPGCMLPLVRKKREDMGTTTLQTLLTEVVDAEHRAWGWRPSADGGSQLLYPNGSRIIAFGLDRSSKVKSGAYLKAYIDQAEELEENEYDDLASRLRQMDPAWRWWDEKHRTWMEPVQQIKSACNPDDPAHFLYGRFKLRDHTDHRVLSDADVKLPNGRVLPKGSLLREVFFNQRSDNVQNLTTQYLSRLATLKGRYHDRYELGLWASFEGLVYPNFDPWFHVIDRASPLLSQWQEWGGYPPPSWRRYRACDFGFRNPFVFLWLARDPLDGTWFVYREIYMTQRTVRAHSDHIKKLQKVELQTLQECARSRGQQVPEYLNMSLSVADHDAEGIATLDECGIPMDGAVKDVEFGTQALYELIEPQAIGDARKAGIYICAQALVERDESLADAGQPCCLADELQGYRRLPAPKSPNREAKEEPRKVKDHACDALRYIVATAKRSGDLVVVRLIDRNQGD